MHVLAYPQCSWPSVTPTAHAFAKLPCISSYLCMYPRASAMFEQAITFLSFSLSRRTGHRERAVLVKLLRSPLASMPQQATASATHTMLLSLLMIFFSSLPTHTPECHRCSAKVTLKRPGHGSPWQKTCMNKTKPAATKLAAADNGLSSALLIYRSILGLTTTWHTCRCQLTT